MRLRPLALFVVLNLITLAGFAQPGDPGGGGNPTVPISGIEFLIGGGLLLGVRKIWKEIKSKKE